MTIKPTKMNWWYESVLDWMMENPDKNLSDCAVRFKVTPTWIYTLTKSDAFKDAWDARRKDHAELISMGLIQNRVETAATLALDHLVNKLALSGETLPIKSLSEIADTMLSNLGYAGAKSVPPGTQVQINIGVNPELLESARARLREVQATMVIPDIPLATLEAGPEPSNILDLEAVGEPST